MWGRHKHTWVRESTVFNEPDKNFDEIKGTSEKLFLELMYGFTVVTWACTGPDCSELRFERVTGRA